MFESLLGKCLLIKYILKTQDRFQYIFQYRQKLELKSTEAGPGPMTAKQAASIIKALDSNYVAVSLEAVPVNHECKNCPSVSKSKEIIHLS